MSTFIDENCHYYFEKTLKDCRRSPLQTINGLGRRIYGWGDDWAIRLPGILSPRMMTGAGVIIPFESYVTRDTCDTCGRTEGTVTVHYADIIHQTYCYNLIDWLDKWTSAWGLPGHFYMWCDIVTQEHLLHPWFMNWMSDVVKIIAGTYFSFQKQYPACFMSIRINWKIAF